MLDEAQRIKNCKSLAYKAAMSLRTTNRLVLSGTPMQNNLQELWSLFSFVQPGLLGTLQFFERDFIHTIMKGGFSKASNYEIAASQECVARLKELILGHILRRMKSQLRFECALPERKENIVFCPMTDG